MTVNKIVLIGRVGSDIRTGQTHSGAVAANFSFATHEKWKKDGQDKEKTEWHQCQAFGKPAEILAKYAEKGSQLYLEGKMTYGEYEKEGVKHKTAEVLISNFQFLDSKGDKGGDPWDN